LPESTQRSNRCRLNRGQHNNLIGSATQYSDQDTGQSGTTPGSKICYRCGQKGHISKNCAAAPTIPQAHIYTNILNTNILNTNILASFSIPSTKSESENSPYSSSSVFSSSKAERFVKDSIYEKTVPLLHFLAQSYVANEVFTIPNIPPEEGPHASDWRFVGNVRQFEASSCLLSGIREQLSV